MRKSAPIRFGALSVRPPLAVPGQRVGLMGGSFNPPHAGHRQVSRIALRRLGLASVWWIVTPGNPLKGRGDLAPFADRLAAAAALASGDPRITVTGFEARLPTAYTAATLAFLRQRFAGVQFVWIMGADNLPHFHRWRQWREIFARLPVAIIDRPGWHLRALSATAARAFAKARIPEQHAKRLPTMAAPAWVLLTGPLSALSSTAIRASPAPSVAQKSQRGAPALETRY